jgi:hypothetical protein
VCVGAPHDPDPTRSAPPTAACSTRGAPPVPTTAAPGPFRTARCGLAPRIHGVDHEHIQQSDDRSTHRRDSTGQASGRRRRSFPDPVHRQRTASTRTTTSSSSSSRRRGPAAASPVEVIPDPCPDCCPPPGCTARTAQGRCPTSSRASCTWCADSSRVRGVVPQARLPRRRPVASRPHRRHRAGDAAARRSSGADRRLAPYDTLGHRKPADGQTGIPADTPAQGRPFARSPRAESTPVEA